MSNSAQNEKFRATARLMHPKMVVPTHAVVQTMADGGAYVECQVWIPEKMLDREPVQDHISMTIQPPWSSIPICPLCGGLVDDVEVLPKNSVNIPWACSECGDNVKIEADTATAFLITKA